MKTKCRWTASVIVITKNQKRFLEMSIPAIRCQQLDGEFEIIVVDSGSTDGALEFLKEQKVKIAGYPAEPFSFGRAFNLGAKEAKGEILVRLSGDAVPLGSEWLEELIEPFRDDSVGAVFSKYALSGTPGYEYPKFWQSYMFPDIKVVYSVKPSWSMGFLESGSIRDKLDRVGLLAGGSCALRRSIWEKRNLNERVIGEDAEYSCFLHIIGYDIVYNPKSRVLHEHSTRHNWPKRVSRLEKIGISGWEFELYSEMIKVWYQRFFSHRLDSFVLNRKWNRPENLKRRATRSTAT